MSQPRYAPGSNFQSCPATTGETHAEEQPCGTYPDSAHRCRRERGTLDPHYRHACLCGHEWICISSDSLDDPAVVALMHPARHAA